MIVILAQNVVFTASYEQSVCPVHDNTVHFIPQLNVPITLGSMHLAIVPKGGLHLITERTYVGVVRLLQVVFSVQTDIVSFTKAKTAI